MSSSARLNQVLNSAWKNNDTHLALDTYNEWQIAQCYYPTRQRIYDAHTMEFKEITIACGKCYHCMESKINEWCTRMYAHAEDFKNVYFVTLTYRSIYDKNLEVNKLLLSKLKQAVWHRDSFNSTHRLGYNPCLLVKSHYQNFMKRLRKNTGLKDLTYVLSGEYGTDYGRPHFHMVLFTNGTLTKADIVRAWSVCLWRDNAGKWSFRTSQCNNGAAYDFPIGRVDFNDLVQNGTFNTTAKVRVDGTYMNAANCFSYVCKYVCKRDNANLKRVNIAYNALYQKQTFVKVFDNEIAYEKVKDYLRKVGYSYEQIPGVVESLRKLTYEKEIFIPSPSTFSDDLSQKSKQNVFGTSVFVDFYPPKYYDFRKFFSPFCEFSRGCPIGSVYATRNVQEFAQGVFTKPLLQDKAFVIPSYFRRKASEHLYGLRKIRRTLKSDSFVIGALPNLYRRFSRSLEDGIPPREYIISPARYTNFESVVRDSKRAFFDASTRERVILCAGDDSAVAQHLKYDRHTRQYVKTRCVPLADWIRLQCKLMIDEMNRHAQLTNQAKENERLRERASLILQDMCGDFSNLRDNFVAKSEEQRRNLQRLYDAGHKSVE